MKKKIKILLERPILLVALFLLVFYTPFALLMPADTSSRAIIIRLGIDYSGEEIEVSAVTFVPTPNTSYVENYKLVNAKAPTVSEGIYAISNYVGKQIVLNLIDFIVVNEEAARQDLSVMLDGLARNDKIDNDTYIICTNGSSKDFLNATLNLNSASDLNIEEIISYSTRKIYSSDSNIESFYQGYFGTSKISSLGYVELNDGEVGLNTEGGSSASEGGQSMQGGAQGGAQSGVSDKQNQGSESKKTTLLNEGKMAIFKEGKLKLILDKDELRGLNWANPRPNETYLKIYNVKDDVFKDADLTFEVKHKDATHHAYFVGKLPVFEINLKLDLVLDQIEQGGITEEVLHTQLKTVSGDIIQKINNEIKKDFSVAREIMAKNKLDLLQVYSLFSISTPKEFKSFLNSLEDKTDFIDYINFKIKVEAKIAM